MAKGKKQQNKSKAKASEPDVKVSAEPAKKKPFNPVGFLQEVRREASKVTWTSRNETMVSTIMVLIMVVIMAFFFLVVDWSVRMIIQFILSLG